MTQGEIAVSVVIGALFGLALLIAINVPNTTTLSELSTMIAGLVGRLVPFRVISRSKKLKYDAAVVRLGHLEYEVNSLRGRAARYESRIQFYKTTIENYSAEARSGATRVEIRRSPGAQAAPPAPPRNANALEID